VSVASLSCSGPAFRLSAVAYRLSAPRASLSSFVICAALSWTLPAFTSTEPALPHSSSTADVQAALGRGFEVKLLHSGGGLVQLSIGGGLFGVRASIDAVAEAREGKVILHPQVFPLEALKLTVFDEPGLYIEGVGASAAAGPSGQGAGYRLSLRASLR
jgi:hypothetical protein